MNSEQSSNQPVTFLCTTGTSISTRLKLELNHLAKHKLSDWDDLQEEIAMIWQFVLECLKTYQPADYPKVGAEINSLLKMGLRPQDRVILLATDTIEGKLCAQMVEKFLQLNGLCDCVEVKIVKGLQAQNGELFRRVGIKNLMEILSRYEDEDVIFNPTAGFKSVVPYLTLAGMLFRKPVKYIHEYSEDVITLADLPITFDDELIFPVEDKLIQIEKDTAISLKEWNRGTDSLEQQLDSLVEIEETSRTVTMSGLGLLIWERFKKAYPVGMTRSTQEPRKKPFRLDDLPVDERSSKNKTNKLITSGIVHHGMQKLQRYADRLLNSPYVVEVVNSCRNHAATSRWIKPLSLAEARRYTQVEQHNLCIVTLIDTDPGYSMIIRTTAEDISQNEQISDALTRKFFRR